MEKISLISRVRAGDRKAFDELCRKYYAMLVSYARLFLRDEAPYSPARLFLSR